MEITLFDKMYINISKISNTRVYLLIHDKYEWLDEKDLYVVDGTTYETTGDKAFYLVAVGTSIYPGIFTITTWIEESEEKPPPPVV